MRPTSQLHTEGRASPPNVWFARTVKIEERVRPILAGQSHITCGSCPYAAPFYADALRRADAWRSEDPWANTRKEESPL